MPSFTRQQIEQKIQDRLKSIENSLGGVSGFYTRKAIESQEPVLDLSGLDLSGLDLSGLDLSDVNLSGANLVNTNLREAILNGANLDCAVMEGTDLTEAELIDTSLRKVDLRNTTLRKSTASLSLSDSILVGTNLQEVSWVKTDLTSLDLTEVDFSKADLHQSNLSKTNLERANLSEANLERANLSNAFLQQTNLARANLQATNLCGANLSKASLADTTLDNAIYDAKTKWPANFKPSFTTMQYMAPPISKKRKTKHSRQDERTPKVDESKLKIPILNGVDKVGFSANSQILVTGKDWISIKFWDLETGGEVFTLPNSNGRNSILRVSSDGQLIASGSRDFTIKLWDATTGGELQTLEGHTCQITALAFSPNNQMLASIDLDSNVRIWNLALSKQQMVWNSRCWGGFHLAFSNDGEILAKPGLGATGVVTEIWDIRSGQKKQTIASGSSGIRGLVFNSVGNGNLLAIAGSRSYIVPVVKLYELSTKQEKVIEVGNGSLYALTVHPQDPILAAGIRKRGGGGDSIELLDIQTAKIVKSLDNPLLGSVTSLAFSANGTKLAGGFNGGIVLWEM